ncbi:MAG TPA: cytochrome b/b6 domain-containing protein [Burkholderiales bacterium]|nr:cytochrome b/b6 domain-containing protein [Burkholderiales bacterium]
MGYGRTTIAFHWLTAILVLVAYIFGPGGSEARVYSPARDFERSLHEVLGLTVFTLTVLRLGWKAFASAPTLPPIVPWMNRISKVVQWSLYVLLVVTPLTAIFGAWLEGHPLTLGVLGNVPPLLAKNAPLGKRIAELHTWLGDAVIWLAGLHAAAALFHHFALRDDVLASMLPASWRGPLRRRA